MVCQLGMLISGMKITALDITTLKAVVSAQHNGGWFILNGSYMFLQLLSGGADLDGYITFKWRIDTVNNMSSMHGSYTNMVKRDYRIHQRYQERYQPEEFRICIFFRKCSA